MALKSKTDGGTGTNQYGSRGRPRQPALAVSTVGLMRQALDNLDGPQLRSLATIKHLQEVAGAARAIYPQARYVYAAHTDDDHGAPIWDWTGVRDRAGNSITGETADWWETEQFAQFSEQAGDLGELAGVLGAFESVELDLQEVDRLRPGTDMDVWARDCTV